MTNELYMAVIPMIHLGPSQWGLTEQTITLVPQRDFATEFFPDEVDGYLQVLKNRADKYLTGGHVQKYDFEIQDTNDGRVIVKVIQHVS